MRFVLILVTVLLLGSVLHGTPPTSSNVHDAAHVRATHVHAEEPTADEHADVGQDSHNHVHLSAALAEGHVFPVRYPTERLVFAAERPKLRPWLDPVLTEPPSISAQVEA